MPLDPEHPKDRLAFYISDSGAKVLITVSGLSLDVPEQTIVVRLDADAAAIAENDAAPPPIVSEPHNLAYVIYTSGSASKRGTSLR